VASKGVCVLDILSLSKINLSSHTEGNYGRYVAEI